MANMKITTETVRIGGSEFIRRVVLLKAQPVLVEYRLKQRNKGNRNGRKKGVVGRPRGSRFVRGGIF